MEETGFALIVSAKFVPSCDWFMPCKPQSYKRVANIVRVKSLYLVTSRQP